MIETERERGRREGDVLLLSIYLRTLEDNRYCIGYLCSMIQTS